MGSRGARPKPRSSGYLPSLDGWRALAILAVFMDHDQPWIWRGHSNAFFHQYGGWGVYLFFAISGLLVCTRILQDESLTGSFRLKSFYLRRFLRIQPAATAYVGVIAALTLMGITHERVSSLLGAVFMYQNYLFNSADTTGAWFLTGHFWTLAVEEHFYLLLSILLYAFRRNRVTIFSLVIGAIYVWQRLVIHFGLYRAATSSRRTDGMLDYLLVPALLALWLRRPATLSLAERYLRPWAVFLAILAVKLVTELVDPVKDVPRAHLWLDILVHHQPLWLYSCSLPIISTMLHPRSVTTRLLEWPPLRFVGRLSYSLYLWHALFFFADTPLVGVHAPWLLFLGSRPWRYLATLLAALASYFWLEKPFIRLGHKLAPPATPGHADLAPVAVQS